MGASSALRSRRAEQTLTRVAVNQGAAGTTVIKSAVLGRKHSVVGGLLTLSVDGTLKFAGSVSGDLSGPFDIAGKGGFAIPQDDSPLIETGLNEDLQVVTTLGAARGVLLVSTE